MITSRNSFESCSIGQLFYFNYYLLFNNILCRIIGHFIGTTFESQNYEIHPSNLVCRNNTAFFFACKKESMQSSDENAASPTEEAVVATPQSNLSSSAAVVNKKESRKFVRTAELKFKAKNVAKTTYTIENITGRMGGFVAYTNLQSNIKSESTNKISADSSVITKHFTVENSMTLRVPNTMLDSTLKAITPLVDYLDFRVIKADDVSIQLLSNQMSKKR